MAEGAHLELHPDAAKAFNEEAESFLGKLSAPPTPSSPPAHFQPDHFIRTKLTDEDIIGMVSTGLVDYRGRETARFFCSTGGQFGLAGPDYEQFRRLAERIQSVKTIRDRVSVKSLLDVGFSWLESRHEKNSTIGFIDFVLPQCEKMLNEVEIWVPIFDFHLESTLELGKVIFRTVTREMLDELRANILSRVGNDDASAIQEALSRERRQLQGTAAATIKLLAEPVRASEIAIDEVEKSTAILRFFHPANLSPHLRCYCSPLGKENLTKSTHLVVSGGKIISKSESVVGASQSGWILSKSEVSEYMKGGLHLLGEILDGRIDTQFARQLLDALLLYSRNSMAAGPADKLVYILAALESLLLKDSNEPIVQNLSERMAFVIGRTVEERFTIKKNVGRIYALRSSFIHHGQSFDDLEALEEFMLFSWVTFSTLVSKLTSLQTKAQLIDELETRKMA